MSGRVVYVYALCEPDERAAVSYIGVSTEPKRRLTQHLAPAQLRVDNSKNRWLRSLRERGLKPALCVLAVTDSEGWPEEEMRLIREHRTLGAALLNGNDGGVGKAPLAQRSHHVLLTLPAAIVEEARAVARVRGVPLATAVRQLIQERLDGVDAVDAPAAARSEQQHCAAP